MKTREERKAEKDRRKALENLNNQINSKLGFIRYLRCRTNKPTPILAEIARHQEEIRKHQERINDLQDMLVNTGARIEQAQAELKELHAKKDKITGRDKTRSVLEEKIASLEARMNEILAIGGVK